MEPAVKNDYLSNIKDRNKKSHIYRKFQLTGLEIAMYLEDEKHKSLYIKMAKFGDEYKLLSLAKDVGDRKAIENKGGYFMRIVFKNMPEIRKAFKKKEIDKFFPKKQKFTTPKNKKSKKSTIKKRAKK